MIQIFVRLNNHINMTCKACIGRALWPNMQVFASSKRMCLGCLQLTVATRANIIVHFHEYSCNIQLINAFIGIPLSSLAASSQEPYQPYLHGSTISIWKHHNLMILNFMGMFTTIFNLYVTFMSSILFLITLKHNKRMENYAQHEITTKLLSNLN